MPRARSSRHHYDAFRAQYRKGTLDAATDSAAGGVARTNADNEHGGRARRRAYLREYLRWLKPQRFAIATVFALALLAAGLNMVEPLFMRFIVDGVLLNDSLDVSARLTRLNLAGALFLTVITLTSALSLLKDFRQRLENTRVMLSLRRSLFERLLRLPPSTGAPRRAPGPPS